MNLQVTIPEGVTVRRDNYIPANQHSEHALRPGAYPVDLSTVSGFTVPEGERPYYATATVLTDGGSHTYYGSVFGKALAPEQTTLRSGGEFHFRLYAYQVLNDDGTLKDDAHFWGTDAATGQTIQFPITES
jgi:hypothetical protein